MTTMFNAYLNSIFRYPLQGCFKDIDKYEPKIEISAFEVKSLVKSDNTYLKEILHNELEMCSDWIEYIWYVEKLAIPSLRIYSLSLFN